MQKAVVQMAAQAAAQMTVKTPVESSVDGSVCNVAGSVDRSVDVSVVGSSTVHDCCAQMLLQISRSSSVRYTSTQITRVLPLYLGGRF